MIRYGRTCYLHITKLCFKASTDLIVKYFFYIQINLYVLDFFQFFLLPCRCNYELQQIKLSVAETFWKFLFHQIKNLSVWTKTTTKKKKWKDFLSFQTRRQQKTGQHVLIVTIETGWMSRLTDR